MDLIRSISEISSCVFGPRPWHIEIRHRVKKASTINLSGFETLKLKFRRLKLWKPTAGARDLHNKDKQRKTSEPIHFCIANGTIKADTIVQYFSSALGEEVFPHVLTDSVSALSIGKRVANGCEFHWTPKDNDNSGSCTSNQIRW